MSCDDLQIENGNFTRIHNQILQALSSIRLSGLQYAIILCVLRFNYGFQRTSHSLSLRFIAKYINSSPKRVSEALNFLIKKNLIIVEKDFSYNHKARVLKFNKYFASWNIKVPQLDEQSENGQQSDNSQQNSPVVDNRNSPQKDNKERKVKEKLKKSDELFETLIPSKLKGNGFMDVWGEWLRYRKEINKPIKSTTAKKQLKLLSEVPDPKAVIEKSILNGWQGLFPDDNQKQQKKEPEKIQTNLN